MTLAATAGAPSWALALGAAAIVPLGYFLLLARIRQEAVEWTDELEAVLAMRSLGDLAATVPEASSREFAQLADTCTNLLDALAEETGRYERTLERIADGIATISPEFKFRTINPSGAHLLGFRDPGELVSENIKTLLNDPQDLDRLFEADEARDFRCKLPDGSEVMMRGEATWHRDGEDTLGLVVFRNITDQRELEENLEKARDAALQNAQLKAEFLANMSHEIRTPMNGLLGMVELLLDTALSAEQEEMARTMSMSAESLLRIINDILDFSKIESGKLTIETTPFALKRMVDEMLTLVTLKANEKSIDLKLEIDAAVPANLMGDPTRIRQVLLNLVGNSVKFTDKGSVTLSICPAPSFGENGLLFKVTDTGIGMTEEQVKNIFTKFVQADSSTTRKFGGTGLGLSISRQLVELMAGRVSVASQPGRGTEFTVLLSLPACDAPSESIPEPRLASPSSRTTTPNVLLVDDNMVNQKVAKRFLEKLGCVVTLADNGQDALDQVRDTRFDIVFMDCQMPVMDGFDATRAIRNLASEASSVRIIAMTANAMTGDRKRCLDSGMDDYLSKPLRLPLLRKAIASSLTEETSN